MNQIAQLTIESIRRNIPNLESAALGAEYFYQSLPLCVIDAVFSIGVRYINAQKAVASWCNTQRPVWQLYRTDLGPQHTISDFIRATGGLTGTDLMLKHFGNNRQRTSSRSGILKADAVIRFAQALRGAGIDGFPDIQNSARAERALQAVSLIPGQRSGLSFEYLLMLAGDNNRVKADRMVCRFVAEAAGRQDIAPDVAGAAVIAACDALSREFPNLTPRLLDHIIWSYQRGRVGRRRQNTQENQVASRLCAR